MDEPGRVAAWDAINAQLSGAPAEPAPEAVPTGDKVPPPEDMPPPTDPEPMPDSAEVAEPH